MKNEFHRVTMTNEDGTLEKIVWTEDDKGSMTGKPSNKKYWFEIIGYHSREKYKLYLCRDSGKHIARFVDCELDAMNEASWIHYLDLTLLNPADLKDK